MPAPAPAAADPLAKLQGAVVDGTKSQRKRTDSQSSSGDSEDEVVRKSTEDAEDDEDVDRYLIIS